MGIPVGDLVEIEISCWETNIWLSVAPDGQRVPVSDQDPLSDIELTTLHDHGILDILLADVLSLFLLTHVQYLNKIFLKAYTPTSRTARWLQDPYITLSI